VSINAGLIEAIAAELVVDASLVEKDWYAIRIIAAIAKVKHPTMRLVFSGGTSLAKVYGVPIASVPSPPIPRITGTRSFCFA
jgi:predicted nucleotidyltransferase component of viral defense system